MENVSLGFSSTEFSHSVIWLKLLFLYKSWTLKYFCNLKLSNQIFCLLGEFEKTCL